MNADTIKIIKVESNVYNLIEELYYKLKEQKLKWRMLLYMLEFLQKNRQKMT